MTVARRRRPLRPVKPDRYVRMDQFDSLDEAATKTREKAIHALDQQLGLLRWVRSTMGIESYRRFMGAYGWRKTVLSEPDLDKLGRGMAGMVGDALVRARTYFVTDEMCQVVSMAAQDMPRGGLRFHDVIDPLGFLIFDEPILLGGTYHSEDDAPHYEEVGIRAILWQVDKVAKGGTEVMATNSKSAYLATRDEMTVPGVTFWLFADVQSLAELGVFDLVKIRAGGGPLPLYDFSGWAFGIPWTLAEETDEGWRLEAIKEGQPQRVVDVVDSTRRLLLATWRILAQEYVVRQPQRPPRALARRMSLHFPEVGDVLIVRLRKAHSPARQLQEALAEAGEEDTGQSWWTHRWLVHGFWRRPPNSGPEAEKTIYVRPFIKGPVDKPLIIKDWVGSLER